MPQFDVSFQQTQAPTKSTWMAVNDSFRQTMSDALQGGQGVRDFYTQQESRARFVKHLHEHGPGVFQPIEVNGYSCLRAQLDNHQLEIRTQVIRPGNAAKGRPVTTGGSIGIYLKGPAGDEEIVAKKIEVKAQDVAEIAGAASVIADIIGRGLSRYLSSLAESAAEESIDVAVDGAAEAASEEIAEGIGLELAIDGLAVVEFVGIVVAAIALLVILMMGIFKKMTYQLTVFNMTNAEIDFRVTYLYDARSRPEYGMLPPVNAVKDTLIPLGGGVSYNLASSTAIFLQNEDKKGIGFIVVFSTEDLQFAVLGDIPSVGDNSFGIYEDFDGDRDREAFYNRITGGNNPLIVSHAHKSHRVEKNIGPYRITLANDKLSGETNYGGVSGYNYTSLLYIEDGTI